ncbi:MAG: YdeI/OmpD-associated family protein [Actinomycetota bacterium]
MTKDPPDLERLQITVVEQLLEWLGDHHGRSEGVLLVTYKKGQRDRYVSRDDVLDALVAHGWVDGRRFVVDDERTMQLITPRRQNRWAASYLNRLTRLEAEGRMHAAGHAALRRARESGLVDELEHVDRLELPDDLAVALKDRSAIGWWESSAPSYRRNVLRWVASAKRPDTRQRRIDQIADHAARGEKVPNY